MTEALIDKLRALPAERLAQVEDFIDFIRARHLEQKLATDFTAASAPAFSGVWENAEDDVYNAV